MPDPDFELAYLLPCLLPSLKVRVIAKTFSISYIFPNSVL